MPDKLTDTEIKKALGCCVGDNDGKNCFDCPLWEIDGCQERLLLDALDLINRLQAKAIKEQNKNSKLRNERNRLQAQNKDLAETVHNLTIEKDALFDKAEELKAEVERLKDDNKFLQDNRWKELSLVKSEAYKEFADLSIKRICEEVSAPIPSESYIVEKCNETIYSTLKELVGDK